MKLLKLVPSLDKGLVNNHRVRRFYKFLNFSETLKYFALMLQRCPRSMDLRWVLFGSFRGVFLEEIRFFNKPSCQRDIFTRIASVSG